MECTISHLLKDGERISGVWLLAGNRHVCRVPGQGGHPGHGRRRQSVRRHQQFWEYTGDGHALAYLAGQI